ncbi:MAG: discoidin domain-containing protein, partial [Verrucomicrobiae bacterium]|nr:discoidin domain-containing protein [Verrucomicrobiae bacterium]
LALAPGNQLWVVNKNDATISVIARASGSVTATHPLPYASAPHAVVVDAAAGVGYVTLEATGEVAKLALSDGSLLGLIDVGPTPRALSLDPSRDRLWVARFISPDASGRMTAIDTTSFTVATVAELAPVMEPDSLFNGRGLPNYLGSVAISPDLTQAYIPSKKDNIFRGLQRDGLPLTFEHTVRSMATRLDLAGGVEDPAGLIDFDNNDFATAAAFSPLGNLVFFTTNGSANVWVVDAYDPGNVFAFDSGGLAPDGLAINADGTRLFVHNFMSRDITVFSIGAPCSGFCGAAPLLDTVGTVASEVLTPQILLGKQLFYDSSDPRLSQESYMSCASCHLDGSHDGRVWDFTDVGEGLRNTIDLRGRGTGHGPLHWSANFDEVQDFEGQIRHLAGGSGLMADADFHAGTRSLPLGTRKAGVDGGLDALAAYLASLTTIGESPHRAPGGTLTPDALAGRQIFIEKNCASCHTGDAFTDSPSLARHDVGTLKTSSGNRLGGTLDGFDTPTLRGLWQTAPYLHDGSAATLREVLVNENISGKHGMLFDLSPTEVDQLVAYLEQIDDTEPTAPAAGTNQAPVLPALADQITPSSHPFQLVVAATDGDGDPLTYSATGLPPGLALDPVTGILAGTPGLPGIHTIHLGVRDPFGGIDSTDFDLEVADSTKTLADISPPLEPYRYVKLTALSEANGNPWASMAEFHLLDANLQPIDRSGWSASASSAETSAEDGSPARAIDGLGSTIWHTEWSGSPDPPHPHDFIVDLGEPTTFSEMTQLPRSGSANGRIIDYEFSASNDGSTWIPIDSGSFPNATGTHTVTFVSTSHGITREWWSGFTGTTVAELESWPAYPDSPDGSELLATADAPQNVDDSYGSRLHGFLVPPVTGTYRFTIASDDASALFLSGDHYATGLDKIAEVTGHTDPLDWAKYPGQQSVPTALEAGKLYYMRALHVEIAGNDHVTIAWMTPGSGTFEIIPSSALFPYASAGGNSPPAFIDPPAPATVTLPEDASVGTVVINPVAWDPDSGQTFSFHIAAGSGPFSIDPTSGVITTSAPLDFEVQTSHEILVEVRDDHATPLSATFALTVNVTNVLESNNEVVLFALTGPGGAFPGHGNPSLIGFAEDPDGDGIPNAIELLYGTLPDVPNHPNPIRMSTIDDGGETYVTYEVDIAKDLDGTLAFDFLGSGDLQAWQVPANPPELVGETATHRSYRIRDDIPLANADRRFLRIRVIP